VILKILDNAYILNICSSLILFFNISLTKPKVYWNTSAIAFQLENYTKLFLFRLKKKDPWMAPSLSPASFADLAKSPIPQIYTQLEHGTRFLR
jgi:hypothetical protein